MFFTLAEVAVFLGRDRMALVEMAVAVMPNLELASLVPPIQAVGEGAAAVQLAELVVQV